MIPSLASAGALALLLQTPLVAADQGKSAWRIQTEFAGLHRIEFGDLPDTVQAPLPSAALSLDSGGRVVPFLVEDGGDGEFGPGDWLEFAAEIASGESTYFHPYARHNVYWLRLDPERARRLTRHALPEQADPPGAGPIKARIRQHLERDQLLIRLPAREMVGNVDQELWYWSKLTHLSSEPFTIDLELGDADSAGPMSLSVGLRGLSELPPRRSAGELGQQQPVKEHTADISGDGVLLSRAAWDGRQTHVAARSNLYWPESETPGRRRLEIAVPERLDEEQPLVDVVMIDWVEVDYTHNGMLVQDQVELHISPEDQGGVLELRSASQEQLVVAGTHTGYLELEFPAAGSLRLPLPPQETSLWVRRAGRSFRPISVEWDRPSELRSYDRQADYLLISHGSLIEAAQELADLHRGRGLTVDLIDVQDIYDEFGDGIVAPQAIRDFLAHAFHNWRSPRPRFVLLLGDASWDTKNALVDDANYSNWTTRQLLARDRFVAKETEDYEPTRRNNRNLIPSWNYHTSEGHAASDAYYTLLAGDDELPDLALGRFPVASAEEVRTITAKIRRYIDEAPLGPWRSRLVWISGGVESHQRRSTGLAKDFAHRGLPPTLILPGAKAQAEDRARIVEALDRGNLVTHFIGHGGRFIWRTGPPDLNDQVDLFGLQDLAQLSSTQALPIVLSVACYSAPFDHPSADSIGEAFLRLPERGAIAFIGASWRNSPPEALSSILVTELSRPGTIGEALMRTKRRMVQSDAIHLFNLLGDPAVPIAAPQQVLKLDHRLLEGVLELGLELPAAAVGGRVAVEFLDAEGSVLDSVEVPAPQRDFRLSRALSPEAETVTVYFWNEATGVDGVGSVLLERSLAAAEASAGALSEGGSMELDALRRSPPASSPATR